MKKKIPQLLLIVALVLVLVGSVAAQAFNTSFYTTSVKRISFETANGELSGLLYMPKGVSESNPRPAVILTHGYLNSGEMQDLNAIELSRRGYVVLALDMYDHGHSALSSDVYTGTGFMQLWAPFWINSMYDAVQYMYDQPYVLKDEAGNGIIGVTGHSMGGFSSTMAVAKDEGDFATTGIRKIYANLTLGSDFSYSGFFGVNAAAFDAAGGGRILGKVAAQFDEFFFNDPEVQGGTVRQKNFVATPDGKTFLQQENGEAGVWYETSDGGKRIVYQPYETHPWNHFSTTTAGSVIEFYTAAFEGYQDGIKTIASDNQIWVGKVIGELVALIGFIIFIIAIALSVVKLPFFNKANTGKLAVQPSAKGLKGLIGAVITIIAILLPAILFEKLYGWSGLNVVFWAALILGVGGAGYAFYKAVKGDKKLGYIVGGCVALFAGVGLAILTKMSLYSDGGYWTGPVVNDIAKWTVGSMFISLLIMSLVYIFMKAESGVKLSAYGVKLNVMAIVSGLCTAVVTVAAAYALLFLVDAVFKTDFRIWTFAFKTFDANISTAVLRYLPTFLAYYIVSSAAICINTNTEKLQGWKGYVLAMALNAGGILLWLIHQYGTLFATGVAPHANAALSGIVLVAMVPTLAIAACISRVLYKRTGNIWTAAFTNGLLMTIMTVANTTIFLK